MKIKRKTEIFVETKRRFTISQPEATELIFCPQCRETMITAEQASTFFGVSRRIIYRFVEAKALHFVETEIGAVMICLSSLAFVLQVKRKGTDFETADSIDNGTKTLNDQKEN